MIVYLLSNSRNLHVNFGDHPMLLTIRAELSFEDSRASRARWLEATDSV